MDDYIDNLLNGNIEDAYIRDETDEDYKESEVKYAIPVDQYKEENTEDEDEEAERELNQILNEEDPFNDNPKHDITVPQEYETNNMPSSQQRSKSVTFSKDTMFNNQQSRIRNSLYPNTSDSMAVSEEGDEEYGPLTMKTYLHQKKNDNKPNIDIPNMTITKTDVKLPKDSMLRSKTPTRLRRTKKQKFVEVEVPLQDAMSDLLETTKETLKIKLVEKEKELEQAKYELEQAKSIISSSTILSDQKSTPVLKPHIPISRRQSLDLIKVSNVRRVKRMFGDLSVLDLSYSKLSVTVMKRLSKEVKLLPNVKSVILKHCELGDLVADPLSVLIRTSPKLEHIDISTNFFESRGLYIICRSLHDNNSLRSINMSDNPFSKLNDCGKVLKKALERNTNLQTLIISLSSKEVKRKTEGHVVAVNVPSNANDFLSMFKVGSNIISLGLTGEYLTRKTMEMIASLTLTYLQHLDLSYSFMGPSTLKVLCEALKKDQKRPIIKRETRSVYLYKRPPYHQLISLNISNNSIGIIGAQYIADLLENNNTLISLNLSSNDIQNAGVFLISDVLKRSNRTVVNIDLSYNNIDDKGYEVLYSMLKENRVLYSIGEIGDIKIELKRRLINIIEKNKRLNSSEIPGLIPLAESTDEKKVPASGQGDGYVLLFDFTMNEWPRGVISENNIIIRCQFQCKIEEGHDKFAWAVMRKRVRNYDKYKYERSNGSEITAVSRTRTVDSEYPYDDDDDDDTLIYEIGGGQLREEIKKGTFAEGLKDPNKPPNPNEYREFLVLSEKWKLGDSLEIWAKACDVVGNGHGYCIPTQDIYIKEVQLFIDTREDCMMLYSDDDITSIPYKDTYLRHRQVYIGYKGEIEASWGCSVFSDEGPMSFKWRLVNQKSNDVFDTEIIKEGKRNASENVAIVTVKLTDLEIGNMLFLEICPEIVNGVKRTNIWTQCQKFRLFCSKKVADGADVDNDMSINFSTQPFGFFELGNIHHWG